MGKTIITHHSPDLDALLGIWLIKKFWPGWEKALVEFVPAGEKILGLEGEDVLHVDTGLGKFDHHQDQNLPPSCVLVLRELQRKSAKIKKDRALARMVQVVSEIDQGNFIHFPEFQTDRFEFLLEGIINGWKKIAPQVKILEWGLLSLEGIYQSLKYRVEAEDILKKEGIVFETPWGKAVGILTQNDGVLDVGERRGYSLVVRKDPQKGYIRVYARNDRGVDLNEAFERLKERDPFASWFLHQSKCLLLNGSGKNPKMRPTKLSLGEVMEVLKRG